LYTFGFCCVSFFTPFLPFFQFFCPFLGGFPYFRQKSALLELKIDRFTYCVDMLGPFRENQPILDLFCLFLRGFGPNCPCIEPFSLLLGLLIALPVEKPSFLPKICLFSPFLGLFSSGLSLFRGIRFLLSGM